MENKFKYARNWEPLIGYIPQGYFLDKIGQAYDFGRIRYELKIFMGYPKRQHFIKQLIFLNLYNTFMEGSTPCILPYTFG